MSSYLSGGGRTYALDLEIIKSPCNSSRTSHTSSPSSTLSEASNSPLAISTRKARTPRKRPNQTYNEAAALLSTAYPSIFSTKHLTNLKPPDRRHQYRAQQQFFDESSEVLLPFRVIGDSGFLLHQPIQDKPRFPFEPKFENYCQSSGEVVDFEGNNQIYSELDDDFDAESILDEEIEEGIESIMGELSGKKAAVDSTNGQAHNNYWYENPLGIGFGAKHDFRLGMRSGMRACRQVEEGNWWNFPIDVHQISPKFNHSDRMSIGSSNSNGNSHEKAAPGAEKKKKKVGKEIPVAESKVLELPKAENSVPKPDSGELLLKLRYDKVLSAWSDKGSPFMDKSLCSEVQRSNISVRLAQIDLFADGGGRGASVLRYKEKRRTRLFSKKIRYEVRRVNADQRPRMKGRFVRRSHPNAQDYKGRKKKKKQVTTLSVL